MVIRQSEIWWCDLPEPTGSGPGYRRLVLVVQGDPLNLSRLQTIVCVPLTSNLKWEDAPGNVVLTKRATGLPKDSVANVSQIVAADRSLFTKLVRRIPSRILAQVFEGIDVVFDR